MTTARRFEERFGAPVSGTDQLLERIRAGDRVAAARFMEEHADLLRRRFRQRLGPSMRRLFDSQDLFSTVLRRVDRAVAEGQVRAESQDQLMAYVHAIAQNSLVDRIKLVRRLQRSDAADLAVSQELLTRIEQAEGDAWPDVLSRAHEALETPLDREILALWLQDVPLSGIATIVQMEPAATRKRWQRIRERLKEHLKSGG